MDKGLLDAVVIMITPNAAVVRTHFYLNKEDCIRGFELLGFEVERIAY